MLSLDIQLLFDFVSLEPTVRAELMEQVPNIAMFLHESRPNFPAAFSRYLVPIVVRYLTDPNNQVGLVWLFCSMFSWHYILRHTGQVHVQSFRTFFCFKSWNLFQVRKTSQAALLVLLEQGLLSKVDMETKVCPVLLELTEPSSDDDYKIEAVAVRYLPF